MQTPLLQQDIPAIVVGINAAAINAVYTGYWVDVSGWCQLTVEIEWTKGAGTGVQFYIDTTQVEGPNTDAPLASQIGSYPYAEHTGSGVTTYYRRQFVQASTASRMLEFDIPINHKFIRITSLLATGSPTAADTAIVRFRLANR